MVPSVLALLITAATAQAADPTAAREAYTGCLRAFLEQSIDQKMPSDDFDTAIDTQCADKEAVFRDAIIRRGVSFGDKRSLAEEDAKIEVDDAKTNFRSLYRDATQPQS